jgi:hypothetical protein
VQGVLVDGAQRYLVSTRLRAGICKLPEPFKTAAAAAHAADYIFRELEALCLASGCPPPPRPLPRRRQRFSALLSRPAWEVAHHTHSRTHSPPPRSCPDC